MAFEQFDKTSSDFLLNYMGTEMVLALPTLRFRQAIAVGKAFRSGVPVIFEVPEIKEDFEPGQNASAVTGMEPTDDPHHQVGTDHRELQRQGRVTRQDNSPTFALSEEQYFISVKT